MHVVKANPKYAFRLGDADTKVRLLDADELAKWLGRSRRAVIRDVRRNPDNVPQPMQLPGGHLLRWRLETVEAWLARS